MIRFLQTFRCGVSVKSTKSSIQLSICWATSPASSMVCHCLSKAAFRPAETVICDWCFSLKTDSNNIICVFSSISWLLNQVLNEVVTDSSLVLQRNSNLVPHHEKETDTQTIELPSFHAIYISLWLSFTNRRRNREAERIVAKSSKFLINLKNLKKVLSSTKNTSSNFIKKRELIDEIWAIWEKTAQLHCCFEHNEDFRMKHFIVWCRI